MESLLLARLSIEPCSALLLSVSRCASSLSRQGRGCSASWQPLMARCMSFKLAWKTHRLSSRYVLTCSCAARNSACMPRRCTCISPLSLHPGCESCSLAQSLTHLLVCSLSLSRTFNYTLTPVHPPWQLLLADNAYIQCKPALSACDLASAVASIPGTSVPWQLAS